MPDWKGWFEGRPPLPAQDEHTATLLYTLWRIRETAPFTWGLTGGTALQSFFAASRRRYSTDVEIITKAPASEVRSWMEAQGWHARPVGRAPILQTALEPDGTLFVIHDYDEQGFLDASPADAAFRHFPIGRHPPPEELVLPLLDHDFLLATKVFGVRETQRGGERFKDAHDLAVGLPGRDAGRVLAKLEAYAAIRGDPSESRELVRQAGAWLQHILGAGRPAFEAWRSRFVGDAAALDATAELGAALNVLERMHASPIRATPSEARRFLLAQSTPKQLAPVAQRLGYDGSLRKEFEKMADFVAATAFPRLAGEAPDDLEGLLAELTGLA